MTMAVRGTLSLYSRRIICSYQSPLISQLRYLRDRLKSINVSNCRLVPVGQRSPERFPSYYSFVRWNSSSAASSGAQNPDVSIFIFSCSVLSVGHWPPWSRGRSWFQALTLNLYLTLLSLGRASSAYQHNSA